MKIAIVCPDDLSIVLFCKGLVESFKKNGKHKIYVISDITDGATDGYYTKIIKSWGIAHIPLKFHRFLNPLQDLKYIFSLYRILQTEMIDTVVNISTKPNIYGTIAARCANVKKILCSVWGRGEAFADRHDTRSKLTKLIVMSFYRIAFKLCDKVWFTNLNDFNYFVSQGTVTTQKTILTKNYVNTKDYYPYFLSPEKQVKLRKEIGLNASDNVVIMVGRMIWAKGVNEFVGASKILKDELPHVQFILVGPKETGSPDEVPEAYLKKNEKSGNFRWVGFRKDVKDLYALADLAVLPSYYREGGFPRALTEPMAMGKPIIASDSVDCRAPVDEGLNGYLVPIKDSQALANAIVDLMNDEIKRNKFGRHSRLKAVKEYDESVIVDQVVKEFLAISQ